MNLLNEFQECANNEIKSSLESILNNGLMSLKKIPCNEALPLSTLQIQIVNDNICVNYLNLSECDQTSIEDAVKIAIYEEYGGIYGIALERMWPFHNAQNSNLFITEISERLKNCVVYVLKPPKKNPIVCIPLGSNQMSKLAYYEFHHSNPNTDAFFQNREGKLLCHSNEFISSTHVTEIKTTHIFKNEDILAILVPENLYPIVKDIYKDMKMELISVPTVEINLQKLPGILDYMHNERIPATLKINAPDFEIVLLKITQKYTNFSLHTSRLHSRFDFCPKIIQTLDHDNKQFFDKIRATLKVCNLGHWAIVHKMYGLSKLQIIENLTKNPQLFDKKHLLLKSNLSYENIYEKIKKLKNDLILFQVSKRTPLSKQQIKFLEEKKIDVIQFCENSYAISCNPKFKNLVNFVVNDWKKFENEAATRIQATFKGFWKQKTYKAFKNKKSEVELKKTALQKSEEELTQLSQKLFIN